MKFDTLTMGILIGLAVGLYFAASLAPYAGILTAFVVILVLRHVIAK